MDVSTLRENDSLVGALGQAMSRGESGLRQIPGLVRAVIERDAWRDREVRRLGGQVIRFTRFAEFVTTAPLEGLGATVPLLKNLCRDDARTLDLLDQALQESPGNPTGANQYAGGTVDNINDSSRPDGTSRTYALRKLRKDRPDLHAEVLAGTVSAHRAMVQAGFRKSPGVVERLQALWAKATAQERAAFMAWCNGINESEG